MKRILIIKTSAIGDIIHTFDVVDNLKARFPDALIDWVVEKRHASLLEAHPSINRLIRVNTKVWRKKLFKKEAFSEIKAFYKDLNTYEYEEVFDFQGNTKSALFTFLAKGKNKIGFGLKSVPEIMNLLVTTKKFNVAPTLNIRNRYLALVENYYGINEKLVTLPVLLNLTSEEKERLSGLKDIFSKVMVAFGSNWKNKRLSEKVLTEFLKRIAEESKIGFIFIWSNDEERKCAERLCASFKETSITLGELSLPLWQALMDKVKCVIAMDSAALHLCGTTATPSFSIFGPSKASIYKPPGERHVTFQGICPYNKVFEKRCPLLRTCLTGACMQIDPEELYAVFKANIVL